MTVSHALDGLFLSTLSVLYLLLIIIIDDFPITYRLSFKLIMTTLFKNVYVSDNELMHVAQVTVDKLHIRRFGFKDLRIQFNLNQFQTT